jgi:hypothetical protein
MPELAEEYYMRHMKKLLAVTSPHESKFRMFDYRSENLSKIIFKYYDGFLFGQKYCFKLEQEHYKLMTTILYNYPYMIFTHDNSIETIDGLKDHIGPYLNDIIKAWELKDDISLQHAETLQLPFDILIQDKYIRIIDVAKKFNIKVDDSTPFRCCIVSYLIDKCITPISILYNNFKIKAYHYEHMEQIHECILKYKLKYDTKH